MSWNATLYSPSAPCLCLKEIQALAMAGASWSDLEGGKSLVCWPGGGKASLFPSMPDDRLPGHLDGLMRFVVHHTGGEVNEDNRGLLQFISRVRATTAIQIEESGSQHEAESLLISMACTYDECLIFAHGGLYSAFGECILGDGERLVELDQLSVFRGRSQPPTQSQTQARRQARIQQRLDAYQVPRFEGAIRWIPEDQAVELRRPQEVAERLLALHGCLCYAGGMPKQQALAHIGTAPLTPLEESFLEAEKPDQDEAQSMLWRIEALMVLAWALGIHERLDWPDSLCHVEAVHQGLSAATRDPAAFVQAARLRSLEEILDELELTTRLHWALRNCHLKSELIPDNLHWESAAPRVPVAETPLTRVVEQRHQALNWLIRFGGDDWDEVDTPT